MEFNFPIYKALHLDEEGFGKIEKTSKNQGFTQRAYSSSRLNYSNNYIFYPQKQFTESSSEEFLKEIVDTIGELSTKAQGLKAIITQYSRLSSDQRVYIKAEGKKVFGFIKVGIKNLFHRDCYGIISEIKPLCVLDFYVHESVQRSGFGKMIFDHMLSSEKISPSQLAYGLLLFINYLLLLKRSPFIIIYQFFKKAFQINKLCSIKQQFCCIF